MYSSVPFKNEFRFKDRLDEAMRVLTKYPDRIPVICERSLTAPYDCPNIDKRKYLVPKDLTMGQFLYVIRTRLKLSSEKALFLFINSTIPPTTTLMNKIYEKHKSDDYYLYINYTQENTFG